MILQADAERGTKQNARVGIGMSAREAPVALWAPKVKISCDETSLGGVRRTIVVLWANNSSKDGPLLPHR